MKWQLNSDRAAIGLSLVCILHCLAIPLVLVLFPTLSLMLMDDYAFHQLILFFIVPVSVLALSMGYRHHRNTKVVMISVMGLCVLVATGFIEHELLGHWGEAILTVIGSLIIASAHLQNARLRKQANFQGAESI
jgi:drug/metabolite transporter (DMT)-like permease